MEIKRTQQSLEIKKVETDQRSEVKKLKPIVPNDVQDSVEYPKGRPEDGGSDPTGPVKKSVDPIAEGILARQITASRLEESGIRKRTDEKPITGKKELGTDEQEAADSTTRDVPETNAGMDMGTSTGPRVPQGAFAGDARSRFEGNNAALRDLVAKSGVDLNPGNDHGTPSRGPEGSSRAGNPLEGGPTGPSNPMDSVNQKYEQAMKFADGMNTQQSITEQMRDEFRSGDQGPTKGYGKDMIADDKGSQSRGDKAVEGALELIDGVTSGSGSQTYSGTKKLNEASDGLFGKGIAVLAAAVIPGVGGLVLQSQLAVEQQAAEQKIKDAQDKKDMEAAKKAADAAIEAKKAEQAKKDEEAKKAEAEKKKAEEEKKKTGGTDQTEESYQRQELEEHKEQVRQALGNLGIDPFALPRRPIIQGDIDPAEDQQKGGEYEPSLIQQFGKYGLIGNPGSSDRGPSGGGEVNLGQRGGNIDYENGSGYLGPERTNDPSDVDTSGSGLTQLNVASRDQKEEEEKEEEEKKVSTQKKR
jgi:hypothetical protein